MESYDMGLGLQGITGPFIGASECYIASVEQRFGFILPPQYREFLRKIGASVFSEDVGFRPIEPSPWAVNGIESFDGFYGMSELVHTDLLRINDELRSILPIAAIAIGNDPGANLILLNPGGEVYFYDRETGRQYLSARDFGRFLHSFEKRSMPFRPSQL